MPARPQRPARKPATKNKKAPSRKPAASKQAAPKKAAGNKAATKKAPAPAKKAPTKKAPAPAKKAPAPAPAKKALPKKAPAPAKKAPAKKKAAEPTRSSSALKATPARDALQALAAKRAISQTLTPLQNDRNAVEAYLRDVDHPFKAEMEAVRAVILGVSDKISERIKWNAPSFYYKEDLGAFNPRATEYAHLILLFPDGAGMDDSSGLLEGNHKDRREAKFHSLNDVKAKKPVLEKLVKNWIALRDK
ncbi:MAG TPA: DUF1801 domain-containing protein [Polyangiaceae bacterium]|nr:DUF1801 domain-containing protein [Polyangiaceae bacterium]